MSNVWVTLLLLAHKFTIKFVNKTANIKYKKIYQFTLLCKSDQVTHPKQQKSFY